MNSRIRKYAFALLALVAGCAGPSETRSASSGFAKPPSDSAQGQRQDRPFDSAQGRQTALAPTIVDIVGRDNVVTISAGRSGPLYTARTRSGQTLFADATLDQVQALHPEIYRQIDGAAAVSADHVIDASIDLGPIGDSN